MRRDAYYYHNIIPNNQDSKFEERIKTVKYELNKTPKYMSTI